MKNNERVMIEKNRINLSMKAMYFNRYLLVRYVSALFFFTNIYWLLSLVMSDSSLYFLPLVLTIALVLSMGEQVRMYSNHTNRAKYTKYSFGLLLFTNVILLVPTCFSSSFTQLYPFLINQTKSKILVLSILIIGIGLSTMILYRLNQIQHNADKQYQRIMQYKEAINL